MTDPPPELLIVMPIYNEQDSVRKVVLDWMAELQPTLQNFVFLAIDDGSYDKSLEILNCLQSEFGSQFEIISRENRGHGQSCLEGYRTAVTRGIPHVLQIDSDGQCDSGYFKDFWNLRNEFDVIYGKRTREDGFRRILASTILRISLLGFGVNCVDPNVPYRLMKTQTCAAMFDLIPKDFFLANIALAVLLKKSQGIRHAAVSIKFRERLGGEPSVPLSKFATKAIELCFQLRSLTSSAAINPRESYE